MARRKQKIEIYGDATKTIIDIINDIEISGEKIVKKYQHYIKSDTGTLVFRLDLSEDKKIEFNISRIDLMRAINKDIFIRYFMQRVINTIKKSYYEKEKLCN